MPSRCTKEFKQKVKKNEQLKAKAKARGEAISSSVPKDNPWDPNLDSWLKALAAKTNGNDVTCDEMSLKWECLGAEVGAKYCFSATSEAKWRLALCSRVRV
ncbi:hypothetical protein Tco_0174307 [Tanacetum coccineum]